MDIRFLDGTHIRRGYDNLARLLDAYQGTCQIVHAGMRWAVRDTWSLAAADCVHLDRLISVEPDLQTEDDRGTPTAFHLTLALTLDSLIEDGRPFVPANLYESAQLSSGRTASYSDGRLAYPLAAWYDQQRRSALAIIRSQLAKYDEYRKRERGEGDFPHMTDLGSMFVSRGLDDVRVGADFPYYEGDISSALDSQGSSARAYHPVTGDRMQLGLSYDIVTGEAADFSAAVRWSLGHAIRLSPPKPAELPFSLHDAVGFRLRSCARTYTEWQDGGAGFQLNFDPEGGYDSTAQAFGASFAEHAMQRASDIFEYGFTGRQLNVAWALARNLGGEWLDRGRRACDHFVRHLTTPSGFMFSHYDKAKRRPLFSIGDPDGPVLHYLGTSTEQGSYLRLMTETATDLLLNWELHSQVDRDQPHWLRAAIRLGDFLVRCQNPDGSWYRAYTMAGTGIRGGPWLGDEENSKSSTAVAIPFLLALAAIDDRALEAADQSDGSVTGVDKGRRYVAAAERAGRFVVDRHVAEDRYHGGTLDNPNVVDKESALLTMSALLGLYQRTRDTGYLTAAERAARVGASWTSLWDVPLVTGTPLGRARVRSTGWGGINSIWGAGVTDIYSLFFLADLADLADLTGDDYFTLIAYLTACGTAQLLSYPEEKFGFADVGMQPEGIAFCDQGVDEGLIAKGNIWGGLGWIYTAGTYGLGGYLEWMAKKQRLEDRRPPS